ncbi:efflux RND transporter permease subunit, partial [Patescibacteria group bacterium]|nr:efflux RND transporter permease subunit [Patescibacteria group bacterium]MBU1754820.1 efflux RND transporter permease subunit [Patescibacteria group bacterium]
VFFPEDDSNFIYVEVEKPQGSELAQTDLSVREVEEILYVDARVESFVTEVGSGSQFGAGGSGSKLANITVNLKDSRKQTSQEIAQDMRKDFEPITSARISISQPSGGPPSGAPVLITFSGDDRLALTEAVERAERILSDIPGTSEITTSTRTDSAEFVVKLDTAKAAQLGVQPAVVADTLRTALYGSKATDVRTGTDDIEVRVLLDLNPTYQDPSETNTVTIDAVRELTVPGLQGPVPLASIATITYGSANTAIKHEDGVRTATVQSTLAPKGNAIAVTQAFQQQIAESPLPEGVTMNVGGETEDVGQTFTEMFIALIAGAALMLAILVLEFNSFRHSLYLLLLIPLSLIGVLFGLMITGQPLSFPSMLGVIALAGVIINHAIILMDSIARIGRENPEQTLTDVVVEAASIRFRPIVLTTVTTVVGMIPLSLASALWGPLAFTIMFGLTFAMVLTLVLVPVLYHRWPGKEVLAHFKPETISS